jgi:tyrosine-protein kinase Etk/Wzc
MNQTNNAVDSSQQIASELTFKDILGRFLVYLPYFIISIVIGLVIAFLVNRYSDSRYLIQTTILIKEKNNRSGLDGAEKFLQGMELLSVNRNIENEQGILKSKSLVEETIRNLDFGISYFEDGSVRKSDLYGNHPFIIELDSNHLQCQGAFINLKFLSPTEIECWIENDGKLFVPKTGEVLQNINSEKKWSIKLPGQIVSDYFSFKITIIEPNILANNKKIYSIKLNSFDGLVNQYFNKYTLKPINKQASILEISREGSYPPKEIAFLNQLCKSYIQLGLDEKSTVTQKTIKFIDEQLKSISDTLGRVEDQLREFRTSNRIIDLSESGSQIMDNILDLEERKSEQGLKNNYYKYLNDYVKNSNPLDQLIVPSVMGVNDPVLTNVLQKMIEVYAKKKTLEMSFQKNNPLILEADQNLINLKNTLLENIRSIQKNSMEITRDLDERISKAEKEINTLPGEEQRLLHITRKFQLSDKLYTYLMEKRAEAGIAGAGINADNKVVDKSMVIKKISPKTMFNYGIAVLISVISTVVLIAGITFFNNRIQNHAQLKELSRIPLVGSIIHNSKNTALVIGNYPKAQISESFRNLRSNISFLTGKSEKKVIMVTSTISGEGKTFIGMNLSSVLAIGGYKTLLIGVDLRKPKIFQDFKLDNSFGLTNYLIGKADKNSIIQKSGIENLDVITSGPTPPNPSELIMSQSFYELIEEYKNDYDYIILDTPPIGLVADGLDIMKHSDILLYVVRQNVSRKNFLSLVNDIYLNNNESTIGLIFNDVDYAASYGYGYGAYGYGYGSSGSYGNTYGYGYGYGYGGGYGGTYGYGEVEEKPKSKFLKLFGR